MTGAGGRGSSLALLVALAILTNLAGQGFGRFSYPLLLPDMREDLGYSYTLAGLLGTVNLIAYLGGVILLSVVSGRLSSAQIVVLGLALCTVGTAVLVVAPDYAALAVGMALTGAGAAGTWVPVAAVVSASVDARRRGTVLGLVSMGFGLGVLLGGQLRAAVYAVAGDGSWREVWLIEVVITAAVLLAAVLWFRPSQGASAGRVKSPAATLRTVPGWLELVVSYTAIGLGYILYASFLTSLLEKEAGFSSSHASTIFSLLGFATVVGAVVAGHLTDLLGRRPALFLASVMLTACTLLVLARSEPWASVSALAFGLPLTASGTVIIAYLGDHLPGATLTAVFAVVTVVFGVTQAVGPWLGGALRDLTGSFTATFILAAAAFALSAAAAHALPRDLRRSEL